MKRDDTLVEAAERACLVAVMLRSSAYDRVADQLAPEDFLGAEHRAIWSAMGALAAESTSPRMAPDAVATAMGAGPERVDVCARLDDLVSSTGPVHDLDAAIRTVRAASVLRQLERAADEIRGLARSTSYRGAVEAVGRAEAVLAGISTTQRTAQDLSLRTELRGMVDAMKARREGDKSPLVSTGLLDLDNALRGGMRPGFVHYLGARPKMGKTALAVQIATSVLLAGLGVVYQTTEVPRRDIVQRVAAQVARVRSALLDVDLPDADQQARIAHACARLANPGRYMLIPDDPAATPMDFARNLRRYSRLADAPPLGLAVVDQINDLAHWAPKKSQNREGELREISNVLKDTARAWGVPLLVNAQLSRACESRADKRPVPSDLRDSGSLEQHAGVVMFLYRDEVYHEHTDLKGIAEVSVPLNRKGAPGKARLRWDGECQRFDDLEWRHG